MPRRQQARAETAKLALNLGIRHRVEMMSPKVRHFCRVGLPVGHPQVQITQHRLRHPPVRLCRGFNPRALHQPGDAGVVNVLVPEVRLVESVVSQGDGRGVGHTVVGGFPRFRMPLFVIAGHNVNGFLQGADVNIGHIVHPEIGRLPPRRQRRLHYRLRVQPQRKLLDAALVHLEGLPLVAAEGFQAVRFSGDGGKEPVFSLKHRRRAGQPPFRQHCRKHCVAAGVGVGASLPVGQHSHPGLPQRQVGRNPQVNRLLGRHRRQPQRPGRAHRAGNCAVGDMVKADVLETEGVSEAAEGFVGHRRSDQQTPPAGAGHFRAGQGRRDAVAGMARLQGGIAVVEVQIADHHPVGEGR